MPKNIDPKSILQVSGGATQTNRVVNNLSSQVTIREGAYQASEITTSNSQRNFLDNNLQTSLDELGGTIRRPPSLGQGAEVFSYDSLSTTISGYPDWGILKQADSPIWERQNSISYGGGTITSDDVLVSSSDAFLYNLNPDISPSNFEVTDPLFNINDFVSLIGGGAGKLHLASQEGEVFDPNSGAPLSERDLPVRNILTVSDAGFTISGFLFPADRGTVALLHWDEGGVNLSPANSVDTIKNRVVAAINLDGGLQGTSPFLEGDNQTFPSRKMGQYDLYEMQTGKYRSDLTLGFQNIPNPPVVPSRAIGAVRLLKDQNAAYFGDGVAVVDEERGHIPVLFGAHRWTGASWEERESNFLSYRLPMLKSYRASDLETPRQHRERFFSPLRPSSQIEDFETAGNYVTLGETHYTHQVARYRHVVNVIQDTQPIGNTIGTFALVHFKSEDAFEKLVRDGIAPSQDDLWSVNLLDYDLGESDVNISAEGSSYSDSGEELQNTTPIDAISNPLVKPAILYTSQSQNAFVPLLMEDEVTPNEYSSIVTQSDASASVGTFLRERGYYTTISGVKYLLPRYHRTDSSLSWGLENSNVRMTIDLPHTTINEAFYADTDGTFGYNYRVPFNPISLNLSSLSGEDNFHTYFLNASTGDSGNITPNLQRVDVKAGQLDTTTLEVQPLGDLGLCTFSEGVWTSAVIKDPAYHANGLPIAKIMSSSPAETSNEALTTKMLYHSARLLSLTENTFNTDWNIYISHNTTARTRDCAFSVFRYDEEGFRVYQPLELLTDVLEEATLQSKLGNGDSYESYYVYRPATANLTTSDKENPDATIRLSAGVQYFIEIHPNSSAVAPDSMSLTILSPFYDYTIRVEDPANFINYFNDVTLSIYNPNFGFSGLSYGSLGYKLYDFKLLDEEQEIDLGGGNLVTVYPEEHYDFLNSGFPEPATAHPYLPALVANDDYGAFINEVVPTNDGTPTYGNFTEDGKNLISVQGMSDPTNSTMEVKAWADSTQELRRKPLSSLFTARKDTQERFLDESYRIEVTFEGFDQVTREERGWDNTLRDRLTIYTLQDPNPENGAIDFYVRDDSDVTLDIDSNHSLAGYLRNGRHWNRTSNPYLGEAQIRALPPMQDSVLSLAKYGQPRRGLLTFQQEDYTSADYFPNQTYDGGWLDDELDTPAKYFNQPSLPNFAEGARFSYLRAFDVAFSRSGTVEDVVGDTSFKFRVYGVDFHDHFHSLLGTEAGIGIGLKVPGLTEWLDCGMAKGFSAQGWGAQGCLLSARQGVSVDEGVYFTELEVGFDAPLFANPVGEVTVLIAVSLLNNDSGRSLKFDGNTSTRVQDRRGLVGIEVLRKSTGQNFDNDEVRYTLDIDLSGAVPNSNLGLISDAVSVTQNLYTLAFSLETDVLANFHQEYFMLYENKTFTLEEGWLTKEAFYTSGAYSPYFEIDSRIEPREIRVAPDEIPANSLWLGYFSNVTPGNYKVYVETISDDNVNPELNASFRGFLGTPTPSSTPAPTAKTNLLDDPVNGNTNAPHFYIWDLVVASNGDTSLTLQGSAPAYATGTALGVTIKTISENTGEVNFFVVDLTTGTLVSLSAGTNPHWSDKQNVATLEAGTNYSDEASGTTSVTFDLEVGKKYKFVYESLSYGNSLQVKIDGLYDYSEVLTASAPHRYEHYAFMNKGGILIYEYTADPVS